ncbi:DarT ssDNA thymidine ADP-ribosyltransferase family protein [Undibacterium aquatile]|uniref:DUF4433 domain-containing protein n=1 Tax=Undibacterium aquatile TaxID=1537398 RepID=A0ABR6XIL4_9BURK|nr:DarT ssDNA thymidine ADP-ribosyltransferase family protein [Undibacterium aquatile]MBC3812752.1 DUF4433 domain-containing protein [Undibacterium aquatile]
MTIDNIVRLREIEEILHFTTNTGILGILDTRLLKARNRLNVDARLEYIFTPNARVRNRDAAWLDHVNLSVSKINTSFATYSGNWHRDTNIWWCVLSFSPEILIHDGVVFTTTNNIYTSVKRGQGSDGFEAMFAQKIVQYNGKSIERDPNCPANHTTCEQAEILYPGELSTEFLRKIYVPNDDICDQIAGQLTAVNHRAIEIEIRESLFKELY